MTVEQQILTIALCVIGTMATRFIPFLLFREKRPTPPYIRYLGNVLPGAVFAMLVSYCLRHVSWTGSTHGIPELIALVVTVALHGWKRQMLVSIAGGTVCYMVLVQYVF